MASHHSSACCSCYAGDDRFATFEDCWLRNPDAHVFPGGSREKMKAGMHKCCFLGIFGVAAEDLTKIKQDIHLYNPNLTTHDILTCMEFGMVQHECVSQFRMGSSVFVDKDILRPCLDGKRGVVRQHPTEGVVVVMEMVLEKEIRQVTGGSVVRVTQCNDVLHGRQGITLDDGDTRGLCRVEFDSVVHTIPCIWLTSVVEAPVFCKTWEDYAIVSLMPEQLVPADKAGGGAHAKSSKCTDISNMVAKFDADSTVIAKVFATNDVNMAAWSQTAQKNAVVDCICERHERHPDDFLEEESICYGDTVNFSWDSCTGTQSIFECGMASQCFFYVDESTAAIRAEARIGWFSRESGAIQWEFAPAHKFSAIKRIVKRDKSLLVIGSRVAYRHDNTRTGTLQEILSHCPQASAEQRCLVRWNVQPPVVTEEDMVHLERSVLTQQVLLPVSLVVGKIANKPSDCNAEFVLVNFQGRSEMGDRIGQAWFSLRKLSKGRLRHRLRHFMSSAGRVVRFTVQERAGISIRDVIHNNGTVLIVNDTALRNFLAAVSTFCRGASRMHAHHITHGDLTYGNITLAQSTNMEHFSLKMIDLDEMAEHSPGNMYITAYQDDLTHIMQALFDLTRKVTCANNNNRDVQKCCEMLHDKSYEARHMPVCSSSAETAEFLLTIARLCD